MRILIAVLFSALLIGLTGHSPVNKQVLVTASTKVTVAVKPPTPTGTPKLQPEIKEAVASIAPPPTEHEQMMAAAGIAPTDYGAADYIISHESGWCPTKWEGEIGFCPESYSALYSPTYPFKGYGLCQSTPAIKMAAVSTDWTSNPVTQLKWCSLHAAGYGGWWAAYDHWTASHSW